MARLDQRRAGWRALDQGGPDANKGCGGRPALQNPPGGLKFSEIAGRKGRAIVFVWGRMQYNVCPETTLRCGGLERSEGSWAGESDMA